MIFHGSNLIPEGLEIGEPKVQGTAEFDELEPAYIIAFSGQKIGNAGQTVNQNGFVYNGIISGITFILCANIGQVRLRMQDINSDTVNNSQENVFTIFTIPRLALLSIIQDMENNPTAVEYLFGKVLDSDTTQTPITKTLVSTPSALDRLYTTKCKTSNLPLYVFRI